MRFEKRVSPLQFLWVISHGLDQFVILENRFVRNCCLANLPIFHFRPCLRFLRASTVLSPMTLLSTLETSSRSSTPSTLSPAWPTFLWNKFTPWFHDLLPCSSLVCRSTDTTSTSSIRTVLHVELLEIVTDKARWHPNKLLKNCYETILLSSN